MKKKWVLISLVGILAIGTAILLAPQIFKPKLLVTMPVPLAYPGMQVWPTPRTFDQPGTVFVLNGNRATHIADVLEPKKAGDETLVSATTTDNWSGGLLAQYLGTTPPKLNVKSNQKISVNVQLSGAERWRIDMQSLQSALNAVKWPTAEGGPITEAEGVPYIVTEAITVRGMTYDVTIDTAQSGALDIPTTVSGRGSISAQKTGADTYTLNQSFSEPYYIFYAASRITQRFHTNTGDTWHLEPEEDRLTWSQEKLNPSSPN